jgi:putative ABC transport system substrate-binding protein
MQFRQLQRREFISLLGGAAAWPLAARAQQVERIRRIGWLSAASGPGGPARAFVQWLGELGHVEGRTIAIEYRWAAGRNERLPQLAAELVQLGVEVIVTVGTPATIAAKNATATIPVVFASAGAPIEKGLVESLARPGGNVTGFALVTDEIKTLQMLKEMAPAVSRVAYVYDPDVQPDQFGERWLARARARSRTLKVDFQPVALRNPDAADRVLAALPAGIDALLLANTVPNILVRGRICAFASERRLPAVSTEKLFAATGCLMSYGEDQLDMHRQAAGYVDRILKGVKPAELPVQQPVKFQLVINLKTAKALGLTLPNAILALADEVIE